MKADKQQQALFRRCSDFDDRLEGDAGGARRVGGIDDVRIPTGQGAQVIRARAGKDGVGQGSAPEAEGAGGQKATADARPNQQQKRTARHGLVLAWHAQRIGKLPSRCDQGRCKEEVGSPGALKGNLRRTRTQRV